METSTLNGTKCRSEEQRLVSYRLSWRKKFLWNSMMLVALINYHFYFYFYNYNFCLAHGYDHMHVSHLLQESNLDTFTHGFSLLHDLMYNLQPPIGNIVQVFRTFENVKKMSFFFFIFFYNNLIIFLNIFLFTHLS